MFDGFECRQIAASGATINLVMRGQGPPVLLLHGYPQTHAIWHLVAPRLARDFTVVAPDLRGYGDSSKPPGGADHSGYGKRAMAFDQVEVMQALGFQCFAVVGHDRGARVAYRLALDHPDRVTHLALLDIVPTHTVFAAVDRTVATHTFHWFFLIQREPLPERLIGNDPEFFLRTLLARWSGNGLASFAPEALAEYVRCFKDPAEDYRAGGTVDCDADSSDYGRRRIGCPTLTLWGSRGRLEQRKPLDVWREWASDVHGRGIDSGHFLPEEAPDETSAALLEFLCRD